MAKISSVPEFNFLFEENIFSSCRGVVLGARTELHVAFKALAPYPVSTTIVFYNGTAFRLAFIKARCVSVILSVIQDDSALAPLLLFLQTVITVLELFTVILADFRALTPRWRRR